MRMEPTEQILSELRYLQGQVTRMRELLENVSHELVARGPTLAREAQPEALPAVMNIQELAEHLKLSPDTVRKRIHSGEWPHSRVGRVYRFTREQVQEIEDMLAKVAAQLIAPKRPKLRRSKYHPLI